MYLRLNLNYLVFLLENLLKNIHFCSMENQFDFIYPIELTALRHAHRLIPGIFKVELIYQSDKERLLDFYRIADRDGEPVKVMFDKSEIERIHSFYIAQKALSWYQIEEIPFSGNSDQHYENSLFEELNKTILSIPIFEHAYERKLLFLFYFQKNASDMGPVLNDRSFDTTQKQVVARIIFNSLKSIIQQFHENRKIMVDYNSRISNMLRKKEQILIDTNKQLKEYQKYLDTILDHKLEKLNASDQSIHLPEESRKFLYRSIHSEEKLDYHLQSAYNFARAFKMSETNIQLSLSLEYFLHETESNENIDDLKSSEHFPEIFSFHKRTFDFLESLESAAVQTNKAGLKLTGSNIGKQLKQQVSPAAISDKLKNHSTKVYFLLKKFPNKWPIIRNRFKPILNVVEKQKNKNKAS
jgi:hypothetical protein